MPDDRGPLLSKTMLLVLMGVRRRAVVLLAAIAATAVVLALWTLATLLVRSPERLFLGGRLNEPLGYVNGQASYYLLAAWICAGAAVQRRSATVAGVGAGLATLLLGVAALSYSRGFALATVLSALAVVVFVPGRLRTAWALLVIGSGLAFATIEVLDVLPSSNDGVIDPAAARTAALAVVASALGAGAVWGLASAARAETRDRLRPVMLAVLLAIVVAAAGVGVAEQAALRARIATQYEAFVSLGDGAAADSGPARLVSGAGNRYDYWRVAWDAFETRPLAGVGAGNYDGPYFRERATTEDVRQPHSLQLQTLAELGVVGAALLLVVPGGVGLGVRRMVAQARTSADTAALAVAVVGVTVAWLTQTSVDWIHLLPGVTAIALAAMAILVRPVPGARAPGAARARRGARRLAAGVAMALVLAVAVVSLSRGELTEYYRSKGERALASDPAAALRAADRAVRVNPASVPSYYVKAAALARFGEADAARRALTGAARREPDDFLTWTLLGDLAVRESDFGLAARRYRRASSLNPQDRTLRRLAADPRTALTRRAGTR